MEAARAAGLPVWAIREPYDPESVSLLRGLSPSWIAVACYPWRLGAQWRDAAPLGTVNIHPSLLPAYRGPAPLFWQLRAGERRTGVTLHRLDAGLDTGPIVRSRALPLPDGIDTEGAESLLAGAGGRLLVDALRGPGLRGRPQPARGSARQGWPNEADRVVPRRWSARRAYNFIRGAGRWGPFFVEIPRGEHLTVVDAVGFWSGAPPPPRVGERRVTFRSSVLGVLPIRGSSS